MIEISEVIKYAVIAIGALCGTIVSLGAYMYKKLIERVQSLENAIQHKDDIRRTMDDKIIPIHKRIDSIDKKLDKILDIMLDR